MGLLLQQQRTVAIKYFSQITGKVYGRWNQVTLATKMIMDTAQSNNTMARNSDNSMDDVARAVGSTAALTEEGLGGLNKIVTPITKMVEVSKPHTPMKDENWIFSNVQLRRIEVKSKKQTLHYSKLG